MSSLPKTHKHQANTTAFQNISTKAAINQAEMMLPHQNYSHIFGTTTQGKISGTKPELELICRKTGLELEREQQSSPVNMAKPTQSLGEHKADQGWLSSHTYVYSSGAFKICLPWCTSGFRRANYLGAHTTQAGSTYSSKVNGILKGSVPGRKTQHTSAASVRLIRVWSGWSSLALTMIDPD